MSLRVSAVDRLPRQHESQLHVVLQGKTIQEFSDNDVLWQSGTKKTLVPVGTNVIRYMRLLHAERKEDTADTRELMMQYRSWLMDVLRSHLDARSRSKFISQLFRGEMAQVLYINNPGGWSSTAETMNSASALHHENGANTAAFLGRQVCSAALLTAMGVRKRYAAFRTKFFWHYGRYAESRSAMTSLIEYADLLDKEREEGIESAEMFESWIRSAAHQHKIEEVIRKFRRGYNFNDHTFKFFGDDAAAWGLADLLDERHSAIATHEHVTGIRVNQLKPDNSVRTFMESLEYLVAQQSRVQSIF